MEHSCWKPYLHWRGKQLLLDKYCCTGKTLTLHGLALQQYWKDQVQHLLSRITINSTVVRYTSLTVGSFLSPEQSPPVTPGGEAPDARVCPKSRRPLHRVLLRGEARSGDGSDVLSRKDQIASYMVEVGATLGGPAPSEEAVRSDSPRHRRFQQEGCLRDGRRESLQSKATTWIGRKVGWRTQNASITAEVVHAVFHTVYIRSTVFHTWYSYLCIC